LRRGAKIARLPKLLIKPMGRMSDDVCELEQARDRLNFKGMIVLLDGKRVRSYDELAALVTQDSYADKDIIDVVLLPVVAGG
jgi:hypothetical protein